MAKNVETKISDKGILTITVDLNKDYGPTKSGKSIAIGTSEGNSSLPAPWEHVKIGVNVYKSLDGK